MDESMDVLLCDELRSSVSRQRFEEVAAALARIRAILDYESEAPPHEPGDGTSLYHCAVANWSIPITGNAYLTYFGWDWNGDKVWVVFLFGR